MKQISFGLWALLLIAGCKTSGDLRRGGSEKPSAEEPNPIKTIENPAQKQKSAAQLERELDLSKGKMLEQQGLHERQLELLNERIKILEDQNAKLIAELSGVASKKKRTQPKKQGKDGFRILWDEAMAAVAKSDYKRSLLLFDEMAKSYPKDKRVGYAIMGLAFSKYSTTDYKGAAISFNDWLDRWPKGKHASLAWFGQGASFFYMKQTSDARVFFEESARLAPRKPQGLLAKKIISDSAKVPRNLFKIFPKWNQ